MSTRTMQARRPPIESCINNITWRINWCQFQQQLKTVTQDEREGWWAEGAGLRTGLEAGRGDTGGDSGLGQGQAERTESDDGEICGHGVGRPSQ